MADFGFGLGLPLAAMLMASASPAVLYANGERGVWISPSDISTLYQDSLGTTPVTAFGQPVGLALDKSKSMALGPEMLSGSWTFTVAGTATATESPAGTLNLTGDGTNAAIADMSIATVIGATYKLTCSVLSAVPFCAIGNGAGSTSLVGVALVTGPNTLTFTATASTTWVRFSKTAAILVVVSTISARQVTHLGAELITNGTFITDLTGWLQVNTGASTVAIVAGVAIFNTNGIDNARLRQSFPTIIGETYLVSTSGTGVNVFIGTAPAVADLVAIANNNVRPTFTFVATTSTTWLGTASATNGATLDNVSIRQIIKDGSEMNSILPWTLSVAGTATATESPTGTLNLTGDGTNSGNAEKVFSTVPGATYRVALTVTGQQMQVKVGTTSGGADVLAATTFVVGQSSFVFTATSANSYLRIFRLNTVANVTSAISVKLIAGAHASQPNSTKRPIYGQWPAQKARNLAQYSSDLSNAYWTKSAGASVAAAGVNTPLGNPAWTITYSAIDGTAQVNATARSGVAGETYTFSCWLLAGTAPALIMRFNDADNSGVVGSQTFTPTASWVRYSTTVTLTHSGSGLNIQFRGSAVTAGTVIVGDILWELASTASAYQKQTAAGVYSDPLYRNLANGSADVGNTTYWVNSATVNGVTAAKVGSGIGSDGLPYADVRFTGTATATSMSSPYATAQSDTPATIGSTFTGSFTVTRIAGTTTGVTGLRPQVSGRDAGGTFIEGSSGTAVAGDVETLSSQSFTVTSALVTKANCSIVLLMTNGATIDITYRIKALQFELGTARTAYQANFSQYQVTEAGLPSPAGLLFDGVDDFLVTPTITPGTDKGQIFAGLRKLSDAARGIVAIPNGAGSRLSLEAPNASLNNYAAGAGGSTIIGTASGTIGGPNAAVLTVLDDIAAATLSLRFNGTVASSSAASQGSGNHVPATMTIGSAAGGTIPFNGILTELAMRFGPTPDASRIAAMERYANSKTVAF